MTLSAMNMLNRPVSPDRRSGLLPDASQPDDSHWIRAQPSSSLASFPGSFFFFFTQERVSLELWEYIRAPEHTQSVYFTL